MELGTNRRCEECIKDVQREVAGMVMLAVALLFAIAGVIIVVLKAMEIL